MIGAVFAAAAPSVPSWSTGFKHGNDMGGLIAAVLAPAGGFGKFLLVLIAVSTSSACAPSIYSFGELELNYTHFRHPVLSPISLFFFLLGNCFMAITPFFARVPRYVFTVMSTAM